MRFRYFLLGILLSNICLYLSTNNVKGQTLDPDSLMMKVEQLGHYLLYKNHDSTYIKNYSDKFTFKLIGVSKFNYFKVRDGNLNSSIKYRPDRRLNLGVGFSYKWFAIDLAFNVGIGEESDFKNNKSIDFQGTIFSSKQFITATYQYYYGYQLHKITGVDSDEFPSTSIRDDIRTINFSLQYLFAFNYDKFSLKAPFIHNELQKKSAGSFLLGAGFNMYSLSADSSVVPSEIQDGFSEELYLTNLNSTSILVSFGYMYTFVWKKHFYVTASLVPGLGIKIGDYRTDFSQPFNTHIFLGLKTLNSIGYNSERIFGGIQFSSDISRIRIDKQLNVQTGLGKAKLFIGYRFR